MASIPMSKGYPHDPWGKPESKWQKPETPKVLTISDLFPQFNRWAIGFDPM